jgi:hypothetical protein
MSGMHIPLGPARSDSFFLAKPEPVPEPLFFIYVKHERFLTQQATNRVPLFW